MSAYPPPKPDKGQTATFHVELEIPLLDSFRRSFLMFRRNESLVEMLPPAEDEEWVESETDLIGLSRLEMVGEMSSHESDIYKFLTSKNPREICHYTTFETNRVQWNKVMNFQEPAIRIFCPDLIALRNTFRSAITVRLIYTLNNNNKPVKPDNKKTSQTNLPTGEQRAVIASVRCALRQPDWSEPSQHFHWDDTLNSNEAMHWGDGDLSILQYSQGPAKPTKGKPELADIAATRQNVPENLTLHFGFGIDAVH